jgi:hypothetical protein
MTPQVLRGTLLPDGTLELLGIPSVPAGEVEVTLRPVQREAVDGADWWSYLQRARAESEADGTASRGADEIEADRVRFRVEGEGLQSDGCSSGR